MPFSEFVCMRYAQDVKPFNHWIWRSWKVYAAE